MALSQIVFVECAVCAAKPGTPVLCEMCQHRRQMYVYFNGILERLAALEAVAHPPLGQDQIYDRLEALERALAEPG